MKDNLFEMLLSLFETSLSQLQENHQLADLDVLSENEGLDDEQLVYFKSPKGTSTRVFTYDEQMKLTKASYQFLVRMKLWGVLEEKAFEQIMENLHSSDSHVVNLQETKWVIKQVLSQQLSEEHQAFLDLILYQSEEEYTLH